MKIKNPFLLLSKFELALWLTSAVVVIVSFLFGDKSNILSLIASLVGVTALIFVAKGHVLGQTLTVIFSLLYAVISFEFRYYGEMITYLGMTAPIAVLSIVSWLRHPYEEGKSEVKVAHLSPMKLVSVFLLTLIVTFAFYYILKYFNTANLIFSTISVATSFLASYLMFLRHPTYALAYAANDIVLIILWILATMTSISYLPMVVCFLMFLANDIYGFYNWSRMRTRQNSVMTK